MKTIIRFIGAGSSGELDNITLDDEDATTQAIAQAAIYLIQSTMSMSAGDSITVTEED